jgi:hypothetical protein
MDMLNSHWMCLQVWAEAFFEAADLVDTGRQVACVQHCGYSILNRASSTVFCTYTYDPNINFSGAGKLI